MSRYLLFIDLTKTFDTVSREGLWAMLPQSGIPQDGKDNEMRSRRHGRNASHWQ